MAGYDPLPELRPTPPRVLPDSDELSDLRLIEDEPPLASPPRRKRRRWKWAALFVGAVLLCAGAGYVFQGPILRALSYSLIHQPELNESAVIVVLGGGGPLRADKAAELYHDVWAPEIWVMLPESIPDDASYGDLILMESHLVRAVFEHRYVPQERIFWSGQVFHSTREEAVYLREWMRNQGIRSALVVCGEFQSKRAQWTLDRAFRNSGLRASVVPAPDDRFGPVDWWTHEEGIVFVQNEHLKTLYYRLNALVGRY